MKPEYGGYTPLIAHNGIEHMPLSLTLSVNVNNMVVRYSSRNVGCFASMLPRGDMDVSSGDDGGTLLYPDACRPHA